MRNVIRYTLLILLFFLTTAKANQETDSSYRFAGDLVFISGQIAINPDSGTIISGDIREQIDQTFKNLQTVAKQAGGSLNDIIKLNVYMSDIDNIFPIVKEEIPKFFKSPFPARTPLGVTMPTGSNILIVIDGVMYLPKKGLNSKVGHRLYGLPPF